MSDIESIRKFANGNSSLEDRGYEGRPMADGSYCYAKHPTSEFTYEHNARIEQLEEDVRTLLSQLAIAREEAVEVVKQVTLDYAKSIAGTPKSLRYDGEYVATLCGAIAGEIERKLPRHTQQTTQKEKQP